MRIAGHYRLAWPAEQAQLQGAQVEYLRIDLYVKARRPRADGTGMAVADVLAPPCDVLVVQRATRLEFVEALEILKHRYGIRIVLDIDDDFSAMHPGNVNYESIHPLNSHEENWNNLRRAAQLADVVTVTTPALAARYGGGKAIVVPNRIPAAALDMPKAIRDDTAVGWAGFVATHPDDLCVTGGAVAKVIPHDRFRVVGSPDGVARDLGYSEEVQATGAVSFVNYFGALASAYDIGIVPLQDSAFNAAKSSLKALEHSALSIPVVMSPTPDNVRVHRDGIGVLAKRPRDWERELRLLFTNDQARLEAGERAKEAAAMHTIEGHIDEWIDAWKSAVT